MSLFLSTVTLVPKSQRKKSRSPLFGGEYRAVTKSLRRTGVEHDLVPFYHPELDGEPRAIELTHHPHHEMHSTLKIPCFLFGGR
jgi:hypothetical protein